MSECQTKAGNQECFEKLSILLLLSLLSLLSLISLLSLFHSLYLDMLNNFCFYVYAQKSLSHSFTFTTFAASQLYSHTLSISHSITLDMLNNFCFHLYAPNSLFIAENCNAFFYHLILITLPCEFRVHWAGSQLKRTNQLQTAVGR